MSTPLGELFDHGMDSLTSTIMTFNGMMMIRADRYLVCLGVVMCILSFYFGTLAAYHTRVLDTCINGFGVIEMHYVTIFLLLLTSFKDSDIWTSTFMDLRISFIVLVPLIIFTAFLDAFILKNAYPKSHFKERFYKLLIPPFSILICTFLIFKEENTKESLVNIFSAICLINNINSIKLIICKIGKMKFYLFHIELVFLYFYTLLMVSFSHSGSFVKLISSVFLTIIVYMLGAFGVNTSKRIAKELKINIFYK